VIAEAGVLMGCVFHAACNSVRLMAEMGTSKAMPISKLLAAIVLGTSSLCSQPYVMKMLPSLVPVRNSMCACLFLCLFFIHFHTVPPVLIIFGTLIEDLSGQVPETLTSPTENMWKQPKTILFLLLRNIRLRI
jgi:hypothetical protein